MNEALETLQLTYRPVIAVKRLVVTISQTLLALLLLCAFAGGALHAQMKAATNRTVSGIITDDSHEPLRGAVVELEDPASHAIISFLTQADGHYSFKRVDSHTDFNLWATFRSHKSKIEHISMFDDHLDKVVNIECKTY